MAVLSLSSILPSVKAGRIRILGVMADKRSDIAPDVPTFKEAGFDVVWGSFRVVAVPAGAPRKAKDALETAFAAVFQDQDFLTRSRETGMGATWMNGADTTAYIKGMQAKAFAMIDDLVRRGLLQKK